MVSTVIDDRVGIEIYWDRRIGSTFTRDYNRIRYWLHPGGLITYRAYTFYLDEGEGERLHNNCITGLEKRVREAIAEAENGCSKPFFRQVGGQAKLCRSCPQQLICISEDTPWRTTKTNSR